MKEKRILKQYANERIRGGRKWPGNEWSLKKKNFLKKKRRGENCSSDFNSNGKCWLPEERSIYHVTASDNTLHGGSLITICSLRNNQSHCVHKCMYILFLSSFLTFFFKEITRWNGAMSLMSTKLKRIAFGEMSWVASNFLFWAANEIFENFGANFLRPLRSGVGRLNWADDTGCKKWKSISCASVCCGPDLLRRNHK